MLNIQPCAVIVSTNFCVTVTCSITPLGLITHQVSIDSGSGCGVTTLVIWLLILVIKPLKVINGWFVELPINVYFHSLEALSKACNWPASAIGIELENTPILELVNDILTLADIGYLISCSGSAKTWGKRSNGVDSLIIAPDAVGVEKNHAPNPPKLGVAS